MKRSSSPSLSRRSTRASTRRKVAEEKLQKEEEQRLERKASRAVELSSTPLLCALPAVLSSGYLHKNECITAASTCQSWYHTWKDEAEEHFPEDSKVEIMVENITSRNNGVPYFVYQDNRLEDFQSPEFARQVFDKVNELKVAAKKGNAAKNKYRQSLPRWGEDVLRVRVSYWGRNNHNGGGIALDYTKGRFYLSRSVMSVRLDPDLRLWTGIRTWHVYDGKPLWP